MRYFGIIKKKEIENFNGKKIADFLIENKLYEEAIKKIYYIENDFLDEFVDRQISNERKIIKSGKVFFIILFEFMKSVSAQLQEQTKKDIYKITYMGGNCKINLNTILINEGENLKLEPTQILLDDFYDYFINLYNLKILDNKFTFYKKFNEEIFGLDFNEQKRITLKHYKEIFKSLFEDNITYLSNDEYDSEDENISFKIENKLKMIFCNRIKYQHKLASINPFFEYLTGNKSIFNEAFYLKNQIIIDQVINYEATIGIMVELNNKYEFEEDFHFINTMEDKRKYEEYSEIFKSFKAYKFTDNLIKTFVEDEKANIESLYEFLRVNKLAKKGKVKFFEYLKNEHKIILTKIISYINYDDRKDFPVGGKKPNDEHIKRVDIIEEKWALFT